MSEPKQEYKPASDAKPVEYRELSPEEEDAWHAEFDRAARYWLHSYNKGIRAEH